MRIISGKYGRRRFDVPTGITARPTTDMARENLFNVLNNFIDFDGITALDLFAGTGAISFELLSRGAAAVTAVEMARTQTAFINKVKAMLADDNLTVVKGDVFKFLDSCTRRFDLIFADPPYDLPRFADVPRLVLDSPVMGPGSIFVMEHPREHDFSALPHFMQHRAYGKVNFSIFSRPE
ncbi:MAG: RsmD family RNA methyltransferase [Muribaculaceae bacterium]|nr:RsmD family RNA methyltransferase [Muribaculaceae bacterium]